jgi:acetyl esterase
VIDALKIGLFRTFIRVLAKVSWWGKAATDVEVHDETMPVNCGRIGVRIYRPQGAGPFPVLHFFHGGGWVLGDLDTHDALCRDLCSQARHLVLAFDYRRAPEYPFPTPVMDSLASLDWTQDHAQRLGGDAARIVLCGDSAGGNLAAVAAQQARTSHPALVKGQVLIYPVTDHCGHARWPSYTAVDPRKLRLTHAAMCGLWAQYLRDSPLWTRGMRSHPLATPLHAEDLRGLPPAMVLIAEQDVLRDEATEYARRLGDAGNRVQVRRYAGQQHAFVGMAPTAAHRQAVADIAHWLQGWR